MDAVLLVPLLLGYIPSLDSALPLPCGAGRSCRKIGPTMIALPDDNACRTDPTI
ncbi:hypothetical protein KC19_1G030900 [Ceratodon purpureus]|uniref:Uncharacterized protein n=1 Tax=Ceratodon purpureus TaxID=3225 RepID=A0A8T0J0T9_CERPU|nr:hypothetical protein KC19_1G030900 [Ceratodon purpureus]